MRKFSTLVESIWSDIQDRSAGDTVRKEDEFTEKDRKDLDKLIVTYANEVVYGRGMGTEACNLDDFCDYIDNEIKDMNKDKILQYVKDYWADEVCDDVDGAIEQAQLEYHQDMNESIWSDMQDRSSGKTIRKEDEITQTDMDAIVDSMNEFAIRVVRDNEKFSLEKFCKCAREHLRFNEDINIENIIKYINNHWTGDIEKEIEGFIEEEEEEKEQDMNESIWSDIQDRSKGDVVRKEDEMNDNDFIMLRETAKMFQVGVRNYANPKNLKYVTRIIDNCDGFIDYILERKKEHFWSDTPDETYDKVIKFVKDNWGDCTGIQEFMDKYLSNINECDGVPGGLTPADVGGMGPAYFPGPNGEPGSGDLPSPTGVVYHQVAPYTMFLKGQKKKKKKKKFRIEDEPCAHSKNPKRYDYVDDFREYVDRTYNNIDRRK